MNAGHEIRAELITDPRTAGQVGDRVMPKTRDPSLEYPLIVYHRISGPRRYSQDGDTGLQSPRYQFDVWAKDPDTADAVADALIEVVSGRTFGGVTFTTVLDDRDDHEADTGLYRRIVDLMPHLEE
ncbi:MAG TPA: DUF3168 domain-containing protein [Candidatus Limnocylindrales bacterium]|nr:DUF3168 domain-containing protein [Candidatus Limnocylindrales bacterium]